MPSDQLIRSSGAAQADHELPSLTLEDCPIGQAAGTILALPTHGLTCRLQVRGMPW